MSGLFSRPESLPVLLYILFFAILYGAGPELRSSKYVFEPPWLLFALNTVFITGLCLLIAGLCFRSFLRGGFLNVLLLGCGVLAFGLSSFAAGWWIRPPFGPDHTTTIRSIGVLVASMFYFLSSLFTAFGFSTEVESRRRLVAGAAYTGVFAMGTILAADTVLQAIPPFSVVGEGPTTIRQVVLTVAVTLLITSALLMMTVYAERKSGFLLYSVNALLLIGAGLVGVALGTPGSPLSWLGRAAQYAGNVYLVVASIQALGEARSRGTTIERALADFFGKSAIHYRALIDMAADAIVSVDREGRIILMNPAAEDIFGYGRGEAASQSLEELIVPEGSRGHYRSCLSGESPNDSEMDLKRKDGTIFPAELSFSPEMKSRESSERTVIIRNVTERRRAEEALRESEERYRSLFESMNEGFALHELLCDERGKPCDYRFLDINPAFERLTGLKRQDVVGRTLSNVMPGNEPYWVKRYGEVALSGEPTHFESHSSVLDRDYEVFAYRPAPGQFAVIFMDITERLEAVQAILKSEARYRSYIEVTGQLGWTTNAAGEVVDEVPALQQYMGRNFDETRGWGWSKALHPDDVELTLAVWRKAVEEKLGYETEYRLRRHDGVYRHFLARGVPILNDDGSVREWVGTCIDITERQRAEESIREAKDHLEMRVQERTAELTTASLYARSLIEASLDPLVTISREGRITDVNRATEQVTGVPRDRLIGRDFSDSFTEPDAARAGFRKVFTESLVRDYPLTIRHASGRTTDVLYHASVYRNEAGEVQGVFAAARDITEIRKAEAALREINESLEKRVSERTEALQQAKDYAEMLIRTANIMIVGLDKAGNVQTLNDAAEKITGYTRAELLGRNWFEVVVPRDRYPRVWNEFLRLQDCSFASEFENPILTKDGRERILSWRNSEIRKGEQVRGVISFGRDITDRKQAEEDLRQARARVEWLARFPEENPSPVARVSVEGRVLYRNQAISEYPGWAFEIGQTLPEALRQMTGQAMTEGRELQEDVELGGRFYSVSVMPFLQESYANLYGWDITERIEAERALEKAREELEDKVRDRTTELMLLLEDLEKSRHDLRKLASELVMTEERERKKISVALHDEVAQTLAAARMRIDLLRSSPGDDDFRRTIEEAQQLLVQAIRETRSLMTDISNPVLYDMGLRVAVQSLAEDVTAQQGIPFSCSFSGSLKALGQDMEVMIFQLVKELVQNIVKHSRARTASIRIVEEKDTIRMVVADDGQGFDVGNIGMVGNDSGFGLFSIRERVKSYGGKIRIDSEPGKGSEVTVELPKEAAGIAASRKSKKRKEGG